MPVADEIDDESNDGNAQREIKWVRQLAAKLGTGLAKGDNRLRVVAGFRLPYLYEIYCYESSGIQPADSHIAPYQTDLLIYEELDGGGWIPRVIIECKLGRVTTHDGLSYSAKARTHRHVHPYLRYGVLLAGFYSIPPRLVRHGAEFDFIAAWLEADCDAREWRSLNELLNDEVQASRILQDLLRNRSRKRKTFTLLHRPLRVTDGKGQATHSKS